jgi:hypothetical protein
MVILIFRFSMTKACRSQTHGVSVDLQPDEASHPLDSRLMPIGRRDRIDDNLPSNPFEKKLERPGHHRDNRENKPLGQGISWINSLHLLLLSGIPLTIDLQNRCHRRAAFIEVPSQESSAPCRNTLSAARQQILWH